MVEALREKHESNIKLLKEMDEVLESWELKVATVDI